MVFEAKLSGLTGFPVSLILPGLTSPKGHSGENPPGHREQEPRVLDGSMTAQLSALQS